MKKQGIFLAMLVVVLVFGLAFTGCKNGTTEEEPPAPTTTKFEGRWVNPYSPNGLTFTFTGNTFSQTNTGGSLNSGTFTFTETTITFTPTAGTQWMDPWTQTYSLDGNTLTLSNDRVHNYGPFVKQ